MSQNQIDVATSMQHLVWLATATRPNEDPTRPFSPQCSSWQPLIVSRYVTVLGTALNTFQDLATFMVPDNSAWIITHVGIMVQTKSINDSQLGAAPQNYGDYRTTIGLNPYGDFGTLVSGVNPSLQMIDQNGEAITPVVPSFAMQGQQVLIPISAGIAGTLQGTFSFTNGIGPLRVFTALWGWLVPPQVANRLQDFKTQWFVQQGVFQGS